MASTAILRREKIPATIRNTVASTTMNRFCDDHSIIFSSIVTRFLVQIIAFIVCQYSQNLALLKKIIQRLIRCAVLSLGSRGQHLLDGLL